jgi:hypothetical protein
LACGKSSRKAERFSGIGLKTVQLHSGIGVDLQHGTVFIPEFREYHIVLDTNYYTVQPRIKTGGKYTRRPRLSRFPQVSAMLVIVAAFNSYSPAGRQVASL